MRVQSISNDVAIDVWNCRNDGEEPDLSNLKFDTIGDEECLLSDLELSDLVESLQVIQFDFGNDVAKASGGLVDSSIVEPIHRALSELASPHQLSQLGFWRWLSNVASDGFFWQFIKWRLNSENQINWAITSQAQIVEVYFYRAWLRGQKMIDVSLPDPYIYAKKGSSDFWRSHVFRQEFGRDREFVKAFLDTVYKEDGSTSIGTNELRKKLIPALRAWSSGATFVHLSYEENLELIEKLRASEI
ncbi:MAG: DUF6339 family protein [Candidatus Thiodiazotropha endolucinida]|nr:DUF6339 family protein [Candidatus Thiodiazotropha taylori]MCW4322492.1 DUF6339 family protein [Candidatus Thiodiazotropha taylori]